MDRPRPKLLTYLQSFRVLLGCSLLLVSALTLSLVQASRNSLPEFDPSGTAIATKLHQVPAMDRPEPQEPVKLGAPDSVRVTKQRDYLPLKSKKVCEKAGKGLEAVGIPSGTEVCTGSATRQSPEALDAKPFRVAEEFEETAKAAAEAKADDPEKADEDTAAATTDSTANADPEPSASPDAAGPSPSGTSTDSEGEGGTPAEPSTPNSRSATEEADPARAEADRDVVIAPAAFHPATVVDKNDGTYLSPTWSQLSPATSPGGRSFSSMVFDPVRRQMVLFDGTELGGVGNETWVWDTGVVPGTWTQVQPATRPSVRTAASMAWDPILKKVIVFGGVNASNVAYNDVWAWDGVNWAQLSPTGVPPAARNRAGMAYDPNRGGMVLFGGVNGANTTFFNDTWLLKNNAWSLIQGQGIAGAPSARASMGLAYSKSTGQLVMFGGASAPCPNCMGKNDTWVLPATGTAWVQQSPVQKPPARSEMAMTYDPGIGGIVMFGGGQGGSPVTFYNDTWAWTGTNWLSAASPGLPPTLSGAAVAADDAGHTILFGGHNSAYSNQTWSYDSKLPLINLETLTANGTASDVFWAGESITMQVTAKNGGTSDITASDNSSIISALSETVLAAGSEIKWNGSGVPTCVGASNTCGDVADLTTSINKLTITSGGSSIGTFAATMAGTQRGCELVRLPLTVTSVYGGSNDIYKDVTVCGGGLGLEKWWTYDTTDLGNGGTASVNAANGNLVVQQFDTPPVQTRGRLALGLGRVYNSQDHLAVSDVLGDVLTTDNRPLGAGWQLDIGDTGEFSGGLGVAGLKLPNVQSLTQPLSMPYVDRDGTRHVFRLRSITANTTAGDLTIPIDIADTTSEASARIRKLLDGDGPGAGLPFAATTTLPKLCIDEAYTGPKGTNMFLFRFVGVGALGACSTPGDPNGDGVQLGWSLVRPDRLRYDFNVHGDLIQITDPTGQQIKYFYDYANSKSKWGPQQIYPGSCGNRNDAACPKITIDYDAANAPAGTRRVDVRDSAKRLTTYIVKKATSPTGIPTLSEVWLPGNALTPGGTPSITYDYSTAGQPCGESKADASSLGQLCKVTDAEAKSTKFGYTKAPYGPDRISKVVDRRGVEDSTKGLATLYDWHDKSDGAPDFVNADMATPAQVANCGSVCERIRYGTIDAYGRVGEIAEGRTDPSDPSRGMLALRQTGYLWDGNAISSCSQPAVAVNHNLCQTIRRAVPSNTAFVPGGVTTGALNGVTVHDQAVDYQYGELGQLLRKKVLLDAGQTWDNANSAITTYGTNDQYFDANGDQRAYNNHVEGSGNVVSTGVGANYSTAVKRDQPLGYWRLNEASGTTMNATVGPNGSYYGNHTFGYPGAIPNDTGITESTDTYSASVQAIGGFANGTAADTSDFTIETWQKTTDTGMEYGFLWGPGSGSNGLVGRASGGRPNIVLTSNGAGSAYLYANNSIADGVWHHVVYTYDGSKTTAGMKIYVDGSPVATTVYQNNLTGSFANSSTQANIHWGGAGSAVDDLSIYTKVLSPARIKAHYDAASGGKRVESDTLYAVTDTVQELSPRGNAAGANWGDYLTSFRRDIPADGTSATTFKAAGSTICGGAAVGNTGILCEADTPASDNVPRGDCPQRSVDSMPTSSPAAPTTAGKYFSTCTTYVYNAAGQRTSMRTPKSHASSTNSGYSYTYYDDVASCSGTSQNNCDLSGTVSAGGWLKAVADPEGEKTVYGYDAGGNIARTWERNATHGKDLAAATWTTAAAPPSNAFTDRTNTVPVTSDSLSVSATAIVAVQPDGTITGAGTNTGGELSNGTTSTSSTAKPANALSDIVKVDQAATGSGVPCKLAVYLTGSGEVWISSASGAAGKVAGLSNIIDVRAGGCHILALEADGDLWSWGSNTYGQIGNGTTNYAPVPVKVLDKVSTMTAGFNHSMAVTTDGALWTWGGGASGQLGLGDTSDHTSPTKVTTLSGVRGLGAGVKNSFAIARDGRVWAWGNNTNGALGVGDNSNRTSPIQITTLGVGTTAGPVRQIVGANNGAAALMADGKVRAWGLNNLGQLGSGLVDSNTPVVVPNVSGAVALAGGWATYAAADKAGTITVWGSTNAYQRADGTNPNTSAPVAAGFDISPYRVPTWKTWGTRDATGNLVTTTYDRLGNAKRIRSGRGNDVVSSSYDRMAGYDAAGRPIWNSGAQHRDPSNVATTTYDAFGNPVKTIDARGIASLATFDSVNRPLTVQVTRGTAAESPQSCTGTATATAWTTDQDGQKICTTSTTYDGVDRKVSVTDADSQVTHYRADAAGRQTGVDVPRNDGTYGDLKSRWIYDRDGNVTTFCPPRQVDTANESLATSSCQAQGVLSTDYVIDNAGRTASQTRYRGTTATTLVTASVFDADGNTAAVTDPNGHQTTFTYDLMGRKKSQTRPRTATKSLTTTWIYDYSGNVTGIVSPGSHNTGSGSGGNLVVDGLNPLASTDGSAHGSGNPFKVPDGAQYRNVTLQNGAYLTANAANGLVFQVSGTLNLCSGCFITMAGKGYAGGAAGQDAANPNPGNGGLHGAGVLVGNSAGGGGGGHKANGAPGISFNDLAAPGAGGLKSGKDTLADVGTNYLKGSGGGGGGGGSGLGGTGGTGGAGGGYIRISAANFTLNGTITAAGAAGGNSALLSSGGGGGGAGGGIWLASPNPINLSSATINVAGGAGGTGANNQNGGAGSAGYVRVDGDPVTGAPADATSGTADMTTVISYDAANRPVDTVEGAQTLEADPTLDDTATPDSGGFTNTRTRSIYNADGKMTASVPPTAFSNSASLTAPATDVIQRIDYDLDGRVAAVYSPRYNSSTTALGTSNDTQQTTQCSTGRTTDLAVGIGEYSGSAGVCVNRTTYDAVGNIARQYLPTSTAGDDRYLEYSYTGDGLAKTITGPSPVDGAQIVVASSKYDGTGKTTSVTDALGNVTQTSYTGDDLVKETAAQAYTLTPQATPGTATTTPGPGDFTQVTKTDYDANGQVKKVTDPIGGETLPVWTTDGLLAQVTAPGSMPATTNVTKYTYDKVGNPIEVRDPQTSVDVAAPVVNDFTYDNLIAATHTPIDDNNHYRSVKYTYTPAGLKASTETARCNATPAQLANCTPGNSAWVTAGTMRLTYGANGRLADQIGRNGASISTTYTQDGQPKSVADPTSQITVTAGYYLDGLLRTVDDGSNANTYAYDASGQTSVRSDQTAAAGSTAGSKVSTTYAYNKAGLVATMNSEVLDQSTGYAYDADGRLKTATTGNHVNDWAWHPDGSLAGVRNSSNGNAIGDFVYRYFNSGNIKTQTYNAATGGYTNTYGYAPGGQVLSWDDVPTSGTASRTTYEYDHNSNRRFVRSDPDAGGPAAAQSSEWTYNRDNSIHTAQPASQALQTFAYNNAGLQTSDGCATTSYDDFDRVSKVDVSTTASVGNPTVCGKARTTTYTYDGLDRQRTALFNSLDPSRSGENGTTKSVFDGLSASLVGQQDALAGDNTRPEVLYQLDATGTAIGYEQSGNNALKAFLDTDGNGNVTNVIDAATGTAACNVEYEPFGNAVNPNATADGNGMCKSGPGQATKTGNSLWYRGLGRDSSTGNYQLGTRTYNPANGSFTTPDAYRVATPSTDLSVGTDPLTMNTYTYVNGNPINMWDPTGHSWRRFWATVKDALTESPEEKANRQRPWPGLKGSFAEPPEVESMRLRQILEEQVYGKSPKAVSVGDGKLATALIHEKRTGKKTKKEWWHINDAADSARRLSAVLEEDRKGRAGDPKYASSILTPGDRKVALTEFKELWVALDEPDVAGAMTKQITGTARGRHYEDTMLKVRQQYAVHDITGVEFDLDSRGKPHLRPPAANRGAGQQGRGPGAGTTLGRLSVIGEAYWFLRSANEMGRIFGGLEPTEWGCANVSGLCQPQIPPS